MGYVTLKWRLHKARQLQTEEAWQLVVRTEDAREEDLLEAWEAFKKAKNWNAKMLSKMILWKDEVREKILLDLVDNPGILSGASFQGARNSFADGPKDAWSQIFNLKKLSGTQIKHVIDWHKKNLGAVSSEEIELAAIEQGYGTEEERRAWARQRNIKSKLRYALYSSEAAKLDGEEDWKIFGHTLTNFARLKTGEEVPEDKGYLLNEVLYVSETAGQNIGWRLAWREVGRMMSNNESIDWLDEQVVRRSWVQSTYYHDEETALLSWQAWIEIDPQVALAEWVHETGWKNSVTTKSLVRAMMTGKREDRPEVIKLVAMIKEELLNREKCVDDVRRATKESQSTEPVRANDIARKTRTVRV